MTLQIRSHIEYLVQTYNFILKIDEKYSHTGSFIKQDRQNSIYIAPIISLDTKALGGGQTIGRR